MGKITARVRRVLTASVALGVLVAATSQASAGGFYIREQSTFFQGTSFAGNAAGSDLSGAFWNPAIIGQFSGLNSSSNYAFIFPDSKVTALPGSTLLGLGLPANSGNIGKDAIVGASYLSYQISPNLVLGLGINAPFGLSTEPANRFWAGQTQARTSQIITLNINPMVSWRVAPGFYIGAGVQFEWFKGRLKNATGPLVISPNAALEAEDFSVGFTAGVLWQPTSWTSIGLGFRSSVDHSLDGSLQFAGLAPAIGTAAVRAGLETPEIVTLSIRQRLTHKLTALGTVEWTNWSRLKSLDIYCQTPSHPALGCVAGGQLRQSLQLQWHDGWMFAAGLEYSATNRLTLRGGGAWEKSPVQAPDERTLRTPDADRIWASIGASYKWSDSMSFDLAYTHIFVDSGRIDRTEAGVRLLADVDTSIDILSVGMKMKFGAAPAPLEPFK